MEDRLTMTQKAIRVLELLRRRGSVHVSELERELSLSRSSVYRWIDSMSLELPIRTERGWVIWEGPRRAGGV